MSCDSKEFEISSAYAAVGGLSESEMSDFEQHTASCLSCRNRSAELENASREYFLARAGDTAHSPTPAGMQQRFEERAARSGITLRRVAPSLLVARYFRVALAVLLLTVTANLSWRVFYQRIFTGALSHPEGALERNFPMVASAKVSAFSTSGLHVRHSFVRTRELSRKSSQLRGTGMYATRRNKSGEHRTYFEFYEPSAAKQGYVAGVLQGPSFSFKGLAKNYVTSGLHLPAARTIEVASISHLWEDREFGGPDEREFRYHPGYTSVSLPAISQNFGNDSHSGIELENSVPYQH